jgi:hypothetical protein
VRDRKTEHGDAVQALASSLIRCTRPSSATMPARIGCMRILHAADETESRNQRCSTLSFDRSSIETDPSYDDENSAASATIDGNDAAQAPRLAHKVWRQILASRSPEPRRLTRVTQAAKRQKRAIGDYGREDCSRRVGWLTQGFGGLPNASLAVVTWRHNILCSTRRYNQLIVCTTLFQQADASALRDNVSTNVRSCRPDISASRGTRIDATMRPGGQVWISLPLTWTPFIVRGAHRSVHGDHYKIGDLRPTSAERYQPRRP